MPRKTKTHNVEKQKPDYEIYRVMIGDLPAGLSIVSENKMEARRQLAIAAVRLGFSTDDLTLV